ncbi:MAG TPA: hypothetical protein EYN06_04020 [Myxococcales bacterium]|nr:hypothetical protein [Myxococcales bacterium]
MANRIAILLAFTSLCCSDTTSSTDLSQANQDTHDTAPESDSTNQSSEYQLMDNNLWQAVDPSEDPFWPQDSTEVVVCPPDAYLSEDTGDGIWFSVTTRDCNYLTVTQPILADLPAGATVQVRVWHFTITSGPGSYHHLIAGGDPVKTVWDVTLEVPTDSGGLLPYEPFESTVSIEKGEPLFWHLSNHGSNSWHLIELKATY